MDTHFDAVTDHVAVAAQPTISPGARPEAISIDPEADQRLSAFGKQTLKDRYLLPGETPQTMFARVACAFADNQAHAQRLYEAMSKLWFMPATPILSNAGTTRGLPISCFLNQVDDSLDGITRTWNENIALAANGGGIGTCWSQVRGIGEAIKEEGQTSGIMPFIHVMDGLTLAISQGSLRRGSAAVYLDVAHPEIEEFLEIRKPSGDFNRKALNLHHGVVVPDTFMQAVADDQLWALKSPHTGETLREISARELWQRILETRLQTGEPYLLFIDRVHQSQPAHHRALGLTVNSSNLCSEITLPTGRDHSGRERTAVCCLASLNLETWSQWHTQSELIEDVARFLDNVLQHFIDNAPPSMANAVYSARRERSIGLGVMGWHAFLQQQGLPLESAMAKAWNRRIFRQIRAQMDAASHTLAGERGACPDAAEVGAMERFSHKLAIAPTASISIICGGTSAGIEPIPANIYTHKTLSGSFTVRNQRLQRVLAERGEDRDATWQSILAHEGSVQHLECLSEDEKAVFRTAFEIDQRWVVELAGDRAPEICQSQSLNLFLPADIDKWDLHMLHWQAWERGVKSLYYCRSKALQRASFAGDNRAKEGAAQAQTSDYEECLACQ